MKTKYMYIHISEDKVHVYPYNEDKVHVYPYNESI